MDFLGLCSPSIKMLTDKVEILSDILYSLFLSDVYSCTSSPAEFSLPKKTCTVIKFYSANKFLRSEIIRYNIVKIPSSLSTITNNV